MGMSLDSSAPRGAEHQCRKIPPGELSINPDADERLAGVLQQYSVQGVISVCNRSEPLRMSVMAHRVNSRQGNTSVAFGANRTLIEPRLEKADS
jgi:hypothetical protein